MTCQSKHQQNCARKDTRSFTRAENRIKLQTHRLVLSSYPGSCCESFGLPEVTWLASASIAQSPTNSKHTHKHTHGHCSPSSTNIAEPGALVSHVGSARGSRPSQEEVWLKASAIQSAPAYQRKPRPLLVSSVWQQQREYIQFYRQHFKPYKVYICE